MDEPRTLIVVENLSLAMSLQARLDQIPGIGGTGIGVSEGPCHVSLAEFPRRPEQVGEVLDVVRAWLDEVGQSAVTVQFRWQLQRSPEGKTRAQRPVLCWKFEDGPSDRGPRGWSLEDMGPAWLNTQDSHGQVTSEPIDGGEWISRSWALSLARANDWTVSLDD